MNRSLKILGLALVAALAMTAVVASAASAAEFKIGSASGGNVDAAQVGGSHKFTANAGSTSCTGATFAGTASEEVESTQTVHPTYTGCTAFGFGATVTTTGCDYVFEATTTVTEGMEHTGNVDIVCESGKKIKVAALGGACTVEVGSQNNLSTVDFSTNTPAEVETVNVNATVGGIAYSQSGFFCTNGNFTNGTYTGNTLVEGSDAEGNPLDVTVIG